MGKEERIIGERAEMEGIIRECRVCRLGMVDGDEPYVVPLSFGYDGRNIYFHCGLSGRKLDILRRNPKVCVEFDRLDGMITAERGCGWSMRFRGVLVFGTAVIGESRKEKIRGLDVIMAQYTPGAFTYPDDTLERTGIIRVEVEKMTGRARR